MRTSILEGVSEGIFRAEAVASKQNPDTRGGLLIAAPPSGLVPVGVLLAALAVGVAAAAVVRVDVTAQGRGVVRPEEGSVVVRAAEAGIVTQLGVRPGDTLDADAIVARIGEAPVKTTSAGTVDFVDAHLGDVVSQGTPLLELVPSSDGRVALMAISAAQRSRLAPGTPVRLRFDEHASDASATTAKVTRVGAQLLTDARARAIFGAEAPKEPSFLVVLELPSGLRSGMLFTGAITVERPTILELVFGRRGS